MLDHLIRITLNPEKLRVLPSVGDIMHQGGSCRGHPGPDGHRQWVPAQKGRIVEMQWYQPADWADRWVVDCFCEEIKEGE